MNKENNSKRIANFLFEIGTMRKLLRSHRQVLLTDDLSDSIASHSYRVAVVGWMLAKEEGADESKVIKMCLMHDMAEVRTGDHNYVHKKYVKEYEDEVIKDQLGTLPDNELETLAKEYQERKTKESLVAKDADLLDQILLLSEYAWQGNQEAKIWLKGKGHEGENIQYKNLKTERAKEIAKAIFETTPSSWWENIWTPKNR